MSYVIMDYCIVSKPELAEALQTALCPKLDELLINPNEVLGEAGNNKLLIYKIQTIAHSLGFTVSGNKAILATNEQTRPVSMFSKSRPVASGREEDSLKTSVFPGHYRNCFSITSQPGLGTSLFRAQQLHRSFHSLSILISSASLQRLLFIREPFPQWRTHYANL